MGNLSQFSPDETATITAIYAWHKKRGDSEGARKYLGASIIGHECDRYLWYSFRQCFKAAFSGRMYRLFETGHLEEARFIAELEGIGCEVYSQDEHGEQIGAKAVGGHVAGHLDGAVLGVPEAPKTWHVLEGKTHNDKSFTALVKVGVKAHKPMHVAQMQAYMGLTKMERALYLARNKDTDAIYSERIRYDAGEFKSIMSRAERIIKSIQPCDRMTNRQDDHRCKYCDAYAICWGTGTAAVPVPAKGCRSCCHATPEMDGDGRWSCAKGSTVIQVGDGCGKHLFLPGLIGFADATDAGDDWIEFVNRTDGAHWRHGANLAAGHWTSEELMRTPGPMVGARVGTVKSVFGGDVDHADKLPLVDRYPHEDSRKLWSGPPENLEKGVLGLLLADLFSGEPTAHEETDETDAYEYDGRYLLVIYKKHGQAAIWNGVA